MQPQIFISYSWKNKEIADAIDEDWKAVGITLTRDVRDVAYKQNLKDFMKRVHESDYVLLLISKDYLESKNCMYEALEMFENADFKRKILPILTSDARVSDPLARLEYIEYWEQKKHTLNEGYRRITSSLNTASIMEELRHFDKIRDSIDDFAYQIQSILCASWPQIQKDGYAQIFSHIGHKNDQSAILEECSRIISLDTEEDQELALEDLKAQHPDNVYVLFTTASVAYRAKKPKKAVRVLEGLLATYPDYYPGHSQLALHFIHAFKEYGKARIHLERALEIKPDYAVAHSILAIVLGEHFHEQEAARYHYEQAIALNPDDSIAHHHFALFLKEDLQDFEGARYHFQRALEVNPVYVEALRGFGLMLIEDLGEVEEAQQYFERTLAIEPDHAGDHNNLGNVLSSEAVGDYEGARQHYERAIALSPTEPNPYFNLALVLEKPFGDIEGALRNFNEVLKLDISGEKASEVHTQIARLLHGQSTDDAGARKHYEQALSYAPNEANTHASLGTLLYDRFDDHKQARYHFERALELDAAQPDVHHNLALVLRDGFEDYTSARHHFEQSLALDPTQADTQYLLGLLLLKYFDDAAGAQQQLEKAIALNSMDDEVYYNLAVLLREQGQGELAIEQYQKAYELNPDNKTQDNDEYFGVQL